MRTALLLRQEIALLDLRREALFATDHPLFAANLAASRIDLEAEAREVALADVNVQRFTEGKEIVKIIAKLPKMISIVAK